MNTLFASSGMVPLNGVAIVGLEVVHRPDFPFRAGGETGVFLITLTGRTPVGGGELSVSLPAIIRILMMNKVKQTSIRWYQFILFTRCDVVDLCPPM